MESMTDLYIGGASKVVSVVCAREGPEGVSDVYHRRCKENLKHEYELFEGLVSSHGCTCRTDRADNPSALIGGLEECKMAYATGTSIAIVCSGQPHPTQRNTRAVSRAKSDRPKSPNLDLATTTRPSATVEGREGALYICPRHASVHSLHSFKSSTKTAASLSSSPTHLTLPTSSTRLYMVQFQHKTDRTTSYS
jgi:hypothetical protein